MSEVSRHETPEPVQVDEAEDEEMDEVEDEHDDDAEPELVEGTSPAEPTSPIARALSQPRLSARRQSPAGRQPPSPSQSPQSSDAENHPPSSTRTKSLPRPATPNTVLSSPTKRTLIHNVRSSRAWQPIDIEMAVRSPTGEGEIARRLGEAEIGSPEKGMTLEEWVYWNAGRAEEALRAECEGLVGRFVEAGVRAMWVLEGLGAE